jgi:hypothetical protein
MQFSQNAVQLVRSESTAESEAVMGTIGVPHSARMALTTTRGLMTGIANFVPALPVKSVGGADEYTRNAVTNGEFQPLFIRSEWRPSAASALRDAKISRSGMP